MFGFLLLRVLAMVVYGLSWTLSIEPTSWDAAASELPSVSSRLREGYIESVRSFHQYFNFF